MNWVIEFDICALAIITILLFSLLRHRNLPTASGRLYCVLLISAWISTAFDLLSIYTIENPDSIPIWLNYIIQLIYLITLNICSPLYYFHVLSIISEHRIITKKHKVVVLIPGIIQLFMILSTPLTHWVFYFDENKNYTHGNGLYFLYALAFFYMFLILFDMFRYRKLLPLSSKATIWVYSVSCLSAMVVQMLVDGMMLISFSIALSAMLAYLSMQNPEDSIDKQTGLYNRLAFFHNMRFMFYQQKKFTVLSLELHNYSFIFQTLGSRTSEKMISSISHELKRIAGSKQLYRISDVRFAIIMAHHDPEMDSITEKIQNYFQYEFVVHDNRLSLTPLLCYVHAPENASYVEDVLDAIEYSFRNSNDVENVAQALTTGEDSLIKRRREAAITHVVKRAARNNEFRIYYQPIFSVDEQRFNSVEALLRLNDQTLGDISPSEFIPIAEKSGVILMIGEFVLDKVCEFILTNHLQDKGIRTVSINLSPIQCMQEHFYRRMVDIMDFYHIPYDMIQFEVTEHSIINTGRQFLPNIKALSEQGIRLALDDYGNSSYHISSILNFPFTQVKFSKELLWESSENEKARILLKQAINLYHELQLEVTVKGVETKEQLEELSLFGSNYLQGFYFSEPLPPEEFLDFLSRKSNSSSVNIYF